MGKMSLCRVRSGAFFAGIALLLIASGCTKAPRSTPETAAAARALFEQATREFHLPSTEASGGEKSRFQNLALASYVALLRQYPQERFWAAQALLASGNIYAAQTNVNAALDAFSRVEQNYGELDWPVLIAWKSAADLLWEAGQAAEARVFYTRIIQRFDRPDASQIVANVVRGSKSRLNKASAQIGNGRGTRSQGESMPLMRS